jgi:PRC-barrel domain
MSMKYLAAAMLASTLLSVPAFAESVQKPVGANAAISQAAMQQVGTWRTSKLIGLNVYNNEDKIGDINELISDSSGKIDSVVIGVGGVLGMGERNVVLAWNQLEFVMEPRSANAASKSTTPSSTTGAGAPTKTTAGNLEHPTMPS